MALSIFQKLKLAFRGWSRRRREESSAKDAEFLRRATSWSEAPAPAPQPATARQETARPSREVDVEGLQVAYLDESQRNRYYLDVSSGEVIFVRSDEGEREAELDRDSLRYRRVPARTLESEHDDRTHFVAALERPDWKARLFAAVNDPAAFREALSSDRQLERAWYNFKNDRATEAIEQWLGDCGL